MAAIVGLRGTGDWGTDERPKNFRESILWRNPNGTALLTALTAKMKKQTVDDPEFAWWEEELNPIRLLVTTAVTTGQTTVAFDGGDAQDLVIGDILLVEGTEDVTYSQELVRVTAVTSAAAISISRAFGGSTAATIADNSYMTRIGSAHEEGSAKANATSQNPTKFSNYAQIFKKSYEITGTAMETKTRTGDPLKNDKKRKMFHLAVDMEYAFLFGKKAEVTGSGGKPLRSTGGLMYYLAQAYAAGATHCIKLWTTTPTEDEILDAVYKVWDYDTMDGGNPTERIVFAGNGFINRLNKLARASASSRIEHTETIKVYGMELQKWVLPQGTLYIKSHPLMNAHPRFTNSAFVLNPNGMIYRPVKNRDIKMDEGPGGKGIQTPGQDAKMGQWLGEVGIEWHHLKTMCYLGNFGNQP